MLEFQRKRRIRKILFSPVTLVILALIAAVFVKAALNIHAKESESKTYLAQAQAQLDNLTAQDQALQQSVSALKTPTGMDAEIRNEYLVVKPGEQVAVIVDAEDASTTGTSTTAGGFWSKVADFFHI